VHRKFAALPALFLELSTNSFDSKTGVPWFSRHPISSRCNRIQVVQNRANNEEATALAPELMFSELCLTTDVEVQFIIRHAELS
jgi:predicted Zn-dependent protease